MGKLLDIRVQARTCDEEGVAKTWPRLCSLVWPDWSSGLGVKGLDLKTSKAIEASLGQRPHGVAELAAALPDLLKFGDLSANIAAALEEPVKQVAKIGNALDRALGDWNTKEAVCLAFTLEEALDAAEESIK